MIRLDYREVIVNHSLRIKLNNRRFNSSHKNDCYTEENGYYLRGITGASANSAKELMKEFESKKCRI